MSAYTFLRESLNSPFAMRSWTRSRYTENPVASKNSSGEVLPCKENRLVNRPGATPSSELMTVGIL